MPTDVLAIKRRRGGVQAALPVDNLVTSAGTDDWSAIRGLGKLWLYVIAIYFKKLSCTEHNFNSIRSVDVSWMHEPSRRNIQYPLGRIFRLTH